MTAAARCRRLYILCYTPCPLLTACRAVATRSRNPSRTPASQVAPISRKWSYRPSTVLLADRTNGRATGTVLRPSVDGRLSSSVYNVMLLMYCG